MNISRLLLNKTAIQWKVSITVYINVRNKSRNGVSRTFHCILLQQPLSVLCDSIDRYLIGISYTVVAIYHSKLTSEGISSPSFPVCKCKVTPEGEFPLTADGLAPPPHMSASCRRVKNADGPVPRRRCLRAGALCSQISPLPPDVTTRK